MMMKKTESKKLTEERMDHRDLEMALGEAHLPADIGKVLGKNFVFCYTDVYLETQGAIAGVITGVYIGKTKGDLSLLTLYTNIPELCGGELKYLCFFKKQGWVAHIEPCLEHSKRVFEKLGLDEEKIGGEQPGEFRLI